MNQEERKAERQRKTDEHKRKIEEWTQRLVADAPPLSPELRDRLRVLLAVSKEARRKDMRGEK